MKTPSLDFLIVRSFELGDVEVMKTYVGFMETQGSLTYCEKKVKSKSKLSIAIYNSK